VLRNIELEMEGQNEREVAGYSESLDLHYSDVVLGKTSLPLNHIEIPELALNSKLKSVWK
jgi:hypothetical protein